MVVVSTGARTGFQQKAHQGSAFGIRAVQACLRVASERKPGREVPGRVVHGRVERGGAQRVRRITAPRTTDVLTAASSTPEPVGRARMAGASARLAYRAAATLVRSRLVAAAVSLWRSYVGAASRRPRVGTGPRHDRDLQ